MGTPGKVGSVASTGALVGAGQGPRFAHARSGTSPRDGSPSPRRRAPSRDRRRGLVRARRRRLAGPPRLLAHAAGREWVGAPPAHASTARRRRMTALPLGALPRMNHRRVWIALVGVGGGRRSRRGRTADAGETRCDLGAGHHWLLPTRGKAVHEERLAGSVAPERPRMVAPGSLVQSASASTNFQSSARSKRARTSTRATPMDTTTTSGAATPRRSVGTTRRYQRAPPRPPQPLTARGACARRSRPSPSSPA